VETERARNAVLDYFERLDALLLLLLPALLRAMATACFCGLPAFISVLMLELTVLRDDPFLSGMSEPFLCVSRIAKAA
jgi:hypothetical protein